MPGNDHTVFEDDEFSAEIDDLHFGAEGITEMALHGVEAGNASDLVEAAILLGRFGNDHPA